MGLYDKFKEESGKLLNREGLNESIFKEFQDLGILYMKKTEAEFRNIIEYIMWGLLLLFGLLSITSVIAFMLTPVQYTLNISLIIFFILLMYLNYKMRRKKKQIDKEAQMEDT